MKIAVIAANGRSGKVFVDTALRSGHSVRAGVFNLEQHGLPSHPALTVIQCDATDEASVRELVKGQDAVASFIGHVPGSDPDVQTVAITLVIKVMQACGLRRIVSLTGTGVRFPGDKIPLIDRLLNLSIAIIDPKRVRDGRNHVAALQLSNLDWTVIRVLKLQNVTARPYKLTEHGPTKPYVGRAEVAQAVLEVLEQATFYQKAPIISSVSA